MNPQRIRVLLVDDDPGDAEMTRTLLDRIDRTDLVFELEWLAAFEEALDAFDRLEHDVYVIDYFLEDRDGLDLVREARRRGIRKPVIMLTGRGSHRVDVEAMQAGASDYLVKGRIDPDLLERSIRYALGRTRSETALRESEERHRSMFDHLPIGLYRVLPSGEFMDANPALVRILGYPDPATLQEHYAAGLYVNPDDRHRFEQRLRRYGVVRDFETVLQRPDGSRVRVRNTARAHRGRDGTVEYYEGAVEDITELRSARRVYGAAQRFDAIYRNASLPILLVALDRTVVGGNPAFQRAFGYAEDELPLLDLKELVAEEDRSALDADLARVAGGEAAHVTVRRGFRSGDGEPLQSHVHASLVRDRTGEPDHVMLFLENVTEAWSSD